jgi:hypothetical protein
MWLKIMVEEIWNDLSGTKDKLNWWIVNHDELKFV